jgi:hypothetical protein
MSAMNHRSYIVHSIVLMFAFLCIAHGASAGILGDGNRVLDTETGLEYLHSKYSWGEYPGHWLFPSSYPGTFPWTLPTPAGYRPATDSEVRSLLNAVGVAPGINSSLAAYTAIDTLHTFMGHLHEVTNGRFERTSVYITATPTPETWDSGLNLLGYTVRVDENWNHTVRTGSIWRTDGAVSGASQSAFLVLVRNTNVSPSAPHAPVASDTTSQSFVSVSDGLGAWYDIAATPGLDIKISSSSLITHIGLPVGFNDNDNLLMFEDPTLGTINLAPGDIHKLSTAVSMLTLSGYNSPSLDSFSVQSNAASLPLFLSFSDLGSSFDTTFVPEPATMTSLALGAIAMCCRRLARVNVSKLARRATLH